MRNKAALSSILFHIYTIGLIEYLNQEADKLLLECIKFMTIYVITCRQMIVLIVDENLSIETLISGCGIYERGSTYIWHVHTARIKELMDAGSHCGSTAGVRCGLEDPGLFV